ncbi:nickel-dependent hydrogenase large subunit [Neptuniibacter sp.]|uniref:nickel-dependent hydrogenase large subunit n=1 Tax=Neptuniibacter sp. TaxID=1962643 RepID=UPI0026162F84|nr:nickel-dependent hydrogenase large subunit [Neptuniibacter sp.]MCP4598820.1 nickel-dependent hydrogenase large subunit [Neptuniibacter sp.]
MSRILVGPFNRVEGDLEVSLDIEQGQVQSARVNSPMFRGFERIMLGQNPMDALVYTPRICGICSVSQSVACARALGELMQVGMPRNGELATNLVLANENMTDLLTHFYLFFMPDFCREVYQGKDWFSDVEKRFKAKEGLAARTMLPARAEFLHLMGIMAGKWPHSLTLQPGGSAKPIEAQERIRLLAIISAFRRYLEQNLFGTDLDEIAELDSITALENWRDRDHWHSSDFRTFLHLSDDLKLSNLGRATDQFMSYGNYQLEGEKLFNPGLVMQGQVMDLNPEQITEDLSYSWMGGADKPLKPSEGITDPSLDNPEAYSWCKAPRLNRQVIEVGALARQLVNRHPLIVDLVQQSGGNVENRMIARMLELALVIPVMQEWVKQIDPADTFCNHAELPNKGSAFGLVEAARGSLGHWINVQEGKISNYQIIAPTTWNFSPRDEQSIPGALEQALVGAPVREGEKEPVAVQHIVRSFDPCMVCTVH